MMNRRRMIGVATAAVLVVVVGANASESSAAAPARRPATQLAAKLKIVLVGDSTVTDGAGWGKAFAKLLQPDAACVNLSAGGRSSKSYRAEGRWKKALAEKPDYVLIQFGHNDCPGKGPQRETDPKTTFPENMARYVDEARAAGIKVVLVTSLTRRHFGADGKIHSDLTAYADATKKVAKDQHVPLIDLHARSIAVLDKLGPKAAAEFDPVPKKRPASASAPAPAPDKTHLSPKGAAVIGRVVADELIKAVPELKPYVRP